MEEGSARRNIVRKGGNSEVARHAKTDVVDDGSSVSRLSGSSGCRSCRPSVRSPRSLARSLASQSLSVLPPPSPRARAPPPCPGPAHQLTMTSFCEQVLYGQSPPIEPGDPLYDPYENDENYVLVSADESVTNGPRSPPRHNYDPDHRRMVFGPMLTLSEFKRRVVEALNEYFSSEDAEETIGTS